MDYRNLPLVGGRVFLFIAQLIILVACIIYIDILYNHNILADKLVTEEYSQTSCTVMSKQLAREGRVIHRYRANFLVTYTANNLSYEAWVTGNGLDQSYFRDRDPQEATLAEYEVGNNYPCWYNPQDPRIAVLVLRHNWMSTFPLAVPSIIAIITLYYLLKGIFQFFGFVTLKKQEKKKRFKR